MAKTFRLRDHILGFFVLYHLGAVLAGSVPTAVGGLHRKSWKTPLAASELDAWHGTLSDAGLVGDRQSFEDGLFQAAVATVRLHKKLTQPFQSYYSLAGTKQGWRMFIVPMTRPAALRIEGQSTADGEWFPMYIHHSQQHDFVATQLRYSRTRPVLFALAWPRNRGRYARLGQYVADRAFKEHPDLHAVQLVWERRRSPRPKVPKAPQLVRERPLVFVRPDAPK